MKMKLFWYILKHILDKYRAILENRYSIALRYHGFLMSKEETDAAVYAIQHNKGLITSIDKILESIDDIKDTKVNIF